MRDGDVRMAIAATFVIVFIEVLALFVFNRTVPAAYAQNLSDNLLSLTGLVVGFFFATTGAPKYVKVRSRTPDEWPANRTQVGEADATEFPTVASPPAEAEQAPAKNRRPRSI